jgi:hypothetical protein
MAATMRTAFSYANAIPCLAGAMRLTRAPIPKFASYRGDL